MEDLTVVNGIRIVMSDPAFDVMLARVDDVDGKPSYSSTGVCFSLDPGLPEGWYCAAVGDGNPYCIWLTAGSGSVASALSITDFPWEALSWGFEGVFNSQPVVTPIPDLPQKVIS